MKVEKENEEVTNSQETESQNVPDAQRKNPMDYMYPPGKLVPVNFIELVDMVLPVMHEVLKKEILVTNQPVKDDNGNDVLNPVRFVTNLGINAQNVIGYVNELNQQHIRDGVAVPRMKAEKE